MGLRSLPLVDTGSRGYLHHPLYLRRSVRQHSRIVPLPLRNYRRYSWFSRHTFVRYKHQMSTLHCRCKQRQDPCLWVGWAHTLRRYQNQFARNEGPDGIPRHPCMSYLPLKYRQSSLNKLTPPAAPTLCKMLDCRAYRWRHDNVVGFLRVPNPQYRS
jgi:hypothetical protein